MLLERTCRWCDRSFEGGPNAQLCPDCRGKRKKSKSDNLEKKRIDITGQRFGRLLAVKEVEKKGKERCWLCKCDCGNEKTVRMLALRSGNTKSCGCLQKETLTKGRPPKDISNQQFGFLTALQLVRSHKNSAVWLCRCVCGNTREVTLGALTNGHVKSCGCEVEVSRRKGLSQQLILKLLSRIYEEHGETNAGFLGQNLPFSMRTLYNHFPNMKLKDIWRMVKIRTKGTNLTGERFGELTVLRMSPDKLRNELSWICKCSCGEETVATNGQLIRGTKKSCGCLRRKTPSNALDLAGKRFGKLTAIERHGRTDNDNALWLCVCDCGETAVANATSLRRGGTTSCGCAIQEQIQNARIELEKKAIDGVAIPLLTKKVRSDSQTGYKGVSKRNRYGKEYYEANITVKGKRKHLGTFSTIEEAIEARKQAEIEYHDPYIKKLLEKENDSKTES